MRSGRYLFLLFFFFVCLAALLLYIKPIGPGSSKMTSYFSTPEGDVHYSQVPENINVSAYIIIDNTRGSSYDLTNWSFKAEIMINTAGTVDKLVTYELWLENLTVLKGEIKEIKITFNSSVHLLYPAETIRDVYIKVWWSEDKNGGWDKDYRLASVEIGSTFELIPFFTLKNFNLKW